MTRKCKSCGLSLDISEFRSYLNKSSKNGVALRTQCKGCERRTERAAYSPVKRKTKRIALVGVGNNLPIDPMGRPKGTTSAVRLTDEQKRRKLEAQEEWFLLEQWFANDFKSGYSVLRTTGRWS